ncbi:MAG TPA: hypothetical protein VEC15_02885 [Actinomycetota bacterium]|nr:hypothetical protein [Actinomycetota bacterium]
MVSAAPYMLVFRVLHIAGGIAWGGSIFLLVFFLQPTAKAVGPAAGPFMRELLGARKLTNAILAIAGVTIVAGGFLYWHDMEAFGGFGDFVTSSFGGWMTAGAISAIIAFAIGLFLTKPTLERMLATGGEIARAGDAPPPELVQRLGALQVRGRKLAITNFTFVAIAAFAMSTARYW